MRAIQLVAAGRMDLVDVPIPEPAAGEVRLAVTAVGACHSDLHILHAPAGAFPTPMTLGHEVAGRVDAVGAGVTGWRPGEGAAVYGVLGCGGCPACLRGLDNQCQLVPLGGVGLSRDGGLADFVVVPQSRLIPVGDLDPAQAAPLTDAALTPYHALELSRPALRPGARCVVIGIGGLGHMALQLLTATTAVEIVAVDRSPAALELATRLGAHHTITAGDDAVERVRRIVGPAPGGAEVVLDFVGAQSTLDLSGQVVAAGGRLVIVGLGGGTLPVRPVVGPGPVPMETEVVVSFWGTRAELHEVIALARRGLVRADVRTFPLEEAVRAYALLENGEIHGRAVIVP